MKIFKPMGEEGFELARPVAEDDYELLDLLIDGAPRGGAWTPVVMQIISKERHHRRSWRRSDAPWLASNALVLRQEAVDVLAPFLLKYGELLPLACEQAPLVVFNPLRVVDALDEAVSTIRRFDDGRIMWIQKHVFRQDVIHDLPVFKIASLQPSPIFVGEEFVERWHAAGLRGLEFQQVWEG